MFSVSFYFVRLFQQGFKVIFIVEKTNCNTQTKIEVFFSHDNMFPMLNQSFQWRGPLDKKMDLHKFAPCKYVARMKILRSKYMAKMVNATFVNQKNRGCK